MRWGVKSKTTTELLAIRLIHLLIIGLVSWCVFIFIQGCSLDGDYPSYTGETGTFRVSIRIPDQQASWGESLDYDNFTDIHPRSGRGYDFSDNPDSRVIPAGSKWLRVTITTEVPGGNTGGQVEITGGTANLSIPNVPVGLNVAHIRVLCDFTGCTECGGTIDTACVLAQRKHGFYMGPNGTAGAGTPENPLHMGVAITGHSGGRNIYQPATIEFPEDTVLYYENWDTEAARSVTFRCETYSTASIPIPTAQTQPSNSVVYHAEPITFAVAKTYFYYPAAGNPPEDDSAYVNVTSAATTGTISGIVTDGETDLPLPGVQVLIAKRDGEGNVLFAVSYVTGTDGVYTLTEIPADTYTIEAKKAGYGTYTSSPVEIVTGVNPNHNIAIYPGEAGEWIWQNPLPQGEYEVMHSARYFIDDQKGWIGGGYDDGGSFIAHTTDGGENWTLQHYDFTGYKIQAIHFSCENNGWAVGYNSTILRTTDGGLDWTPVDPAVVGIPTGKELRTVWFTDSQRGWIGSRNDSRLFYTTNGGFGQNSWNSKTLEGISHIFYLSFADSQNGLIGTGTGGRIYYTSNANNNGGTWNYHTLSKGASGEFIESYDIFFKDNTIGWIGSVEWPVGWTAPLRTYIVRYKWNGTSYDWSTATINTGIYSISFKDNNTGYAAGLEVHRTINGSTTNTWDKVTFFPTIVHKEGSYIVQAIPGTDIVYVWSKDNNNKKGPTWKSTDNGVTWQEVAPTYENLNGIHFVNETHGWAVGDNGTILHTEDGGNTWTKQNSGTTLNLLNVHFSSTNPLRGAIAADTAVLHTSDGGANWTRFNTNSNQSTILDVYMYSSTRCVAPGFTNSFGNPSRGRLYTASINDSTGAWSWTTVRFNNDGVSVNKYIRSIAYSGLRGCVVGDSGFTAYTTNGGFGQDDWTRVTISSPSTPNLKGVCFLDADTILAVGDGGEVYRSTDNGQNWTRTAVLGVNLKSVTRADDNTAWAVGDGGKIFFTTDQGLTWTESISGTTQNLTSVSFPNQYRGWTAGASGTVKHYMKKQPFAMSGTITVEYADHDPPVSVPVSGALVTSGDTRVLTGIDGSFSMFPTGNTITVSAPGLVPYTETINIDGDLNDYNIELTEFAGVYAGGWHNAAVRKDNKAWGWGDAAEFGVGDGGGRFAPARVLKATKEQETNVIAAAGGWTHTVFLKSDGTVYATGKNAYGQLGTGDDKIGVHSLTTVQVKCSIDGYLKNVIAVTAGAYHSMALKSDGTVWAWGRNDKGQLGNGSYDVSGIPIQVSGLGAGSIIAIAGGEGHSLSLRSDGKLLAWGANQYGQLGNDSISNSPAPVEVLN
jgi:photosystem II stability/assembly factor-like uncharacterized protein